MSSQMCITPSCLRLQERACKAAILCRYRANGQELLALGAAADCCRENCNSVCDVGRQVAHAACHGQRGQWVV